MTGKRINLNEDWYIHSSDGLSRDGEAMSRAGIELGTWYSCTLPATVLGTLVEHGVFQDPFFGKNLALIPGQGPPAQNFSNHKMPEESPFAVSWWFRKEFTAPEKLGSYASLQFDGINYRANIWLNGTQIASADEIVGAYRDFEFQVETLLRREGKNVLAVEIFPPQPCELAITWVDWNPSPPDKNMGLWRDVWLSWGGAVALRDPVVHTALDETGKAHLRVGGDLVNRSDRPQRAVVRGTFEGGSFSRSFDIEAGQRIPFDISETDADCLRVDHPRLWWPRFMGEPHLYHLALQVEVSGAQSDAEELHFGIREVDGSKDDNGQVLFRINREPVLIRGAGWATDLFLRRDRDREWAQIDYVLAMNLNTIRFEGMLERKEFLERCDREGLLVISGWCCCDQWEKWDEWKDENYHVAAESLRSQLRRVRRHPCMIAWWYGSDFAPPPPVERRYLQVIEEERWPNAAHSSASHRPSELTGPSGMKMEGPYEYVPPDYWLQDRERGGAFGFATEICPGPAIPPIESLRKMIPEDHLWPVDEVWNFHAGGQEFHNIKLFTEALEARYGVCNSAEEFATYAQLLTYETQRAMFEAYARRKFQATGVIQWMLNNAWPSIIWHLYDYYLRPAGGFFATQRACEPLHVLYDHTEAAVVVDNQYRQEFSGLRLSVRVLDLELNELYSTSRTVDVTANDKVEVLRLLDIESSEPYFIDLRLHSAQRELKSRNFYWQSHEDDVLDHENGNWFYTPVTKHANFQALRQLPKVDLNATVRWASEGEREELELELENESDGLAFFVQSRVCNSKGEDILPVTWNDNYCSLLPGDRVHLRVRVPEAYRPDARIELSGPNLITKVHSPNSGPNGDSPGGRFYEGSKGEGDDSAPSDDTNGELRSREKPPSAHDIVIFGAAGDLALCKLFPALYYLYCAGTLDHHNRIIGVDLIDCDTQDFHARILKSLHARIPTPELFAGNLTRFLGLISYHRSQASARDDASGLESLLSEGERTRLFYLATPCHLYASICSRLRAAGLLGQGSRIVLEKPIGTDHASSESISSLVDKELPDHQIFRIDHYLGKETVQNLLALRFGNIIFENLWGANAIQHIEISVAEDMGVDERMDFYDRTGALRDMVQSHLLQLLCLVAMEVPHTLAPEAIRQEKLKVLHALRPIEGSAVDDTVIRGQYRGYAEDLGRSSRTETYVAIRAEVDNWRWSGVPFYLRTGKCMSRRYSRIVVQFREVPKVIFGQGTQLQANQLVLHLQPDDGIELLLMAKRPGHGMEMQATSLSLDFLKHDDGRRSNAYERLLEDAIVGDPTLFLSREEVEIAWSWIDPLVAHWKKIDPTLHLYDRGQPGPDAALSLFPTGVSWSKENWPT